MSDIAKTDETITSAADDRASKIADQQGECAAIARCILAKQRAMKKAIADGESKVGAEMKGERAFLRALPPLSGFDNIRDFIACVTYALATDVIIRSGAEPLLDAAKIALATLRHQPKSRAA
jgi:hypothetical protein